MGDKHEEPSLRADLVSPKVTTSSSNPGRLEEMVQEFQEAEEWEEEDEVDGEEYDDELEDDNLLVTLGFVEKPKKSHSLLRHLFPSKAGGTPAWLDPLNLPPEKSRMCDFCGESLQFLLQVYAPISEKQAAFHRTLFVFMCQKMKCLLQDQHEQWKRTREDSPRSVKVFRCQLPRINPFYSSHPPKYDGTDRPSGDGAPLCCWCGTWKGDKVCSSCKKARYCSEKHQAMHWRLGHKSDCRQSISSQVCGSIPSNSSTKLPESFACKTVWPEFEIVNEDEGELDERASERNGSHMSLVAKTEQAGKTYETWFNRFEVGVDQKKWVSFQERIAYAPEQVMRYCRDVKAKPLWPLSTGIPSKADIPKCNSCGGPSSYEFQILPQLLYYFGVKNDADSLDWANIIVYTCVASCEEGIGYKEEFAWVQLYA